MTSPQPLFRNNPELIAMIHVQALPGTPRSMLDPQGIIGHALDEAAIYAAAGVQVIMIENMHDRPYMAGSVGPEITAMMTAVGSAIRYAHPDSTIGVQVLAGANKEALAVALAAGLDFIRVEGYTFAHVADEGWIEASAGALLRYRSAIKADHIKVMADVKKKHSAHAVTSDLSAEQVAAASKFFLCDGVVLTGASTGLPADIIELRRIKANVDIPVFIGSGITPESVSDYHLADGFIVGSSLKKGGRWDQPIDSGRVRDMVDAVKLLH